jgi:hypothetical protein
MKNPIVSTGLDQTVVFLQHSHSHFLMIAGVPNVFILNIVLLHMLLPGTVFMLAPSGVVPVFVEQDHCARSDMISKRCQHCVSTGIQVSIDV